jgi:hypothetical protein
MDAKKLFHLVVVGGTLIGVGEGCGATTQSTSQPTTTGGTISRTNDGGVNDAGEPIDVPFW